MNWIDFVVLALIILSALVGYWKGLIRSVFKVASFVVAGFLSMQFYPMVSQMLIKNFHLDETMMGIISKNLEKIISSEQIQQAAMQQALPTTGVGDVNALISSWNLPKPVESMIADNLTVQANQIAGTLADSISKSLATVLVNIVSMILIFAVISIVLIFVRNLLEGIASLPVLSEFNHLGGIVFGALEGLIFVYILFAVLTIFASLESVQSIVTSVNSSLIAKGFYEHNLLLIWLLGGK